MKTPLLLIIILFSLSSVKSQEMKIMTYNIKYANENDGDNSWSKRKDWITDQIRFYEPDVLGVQEALKSQLDHFTGNINSYGFIGTGRDGEGQGEYSAILYKKDELEVLDKGTFWLSESPDKISTGWDAALNRICTYALFKEKDSGKKFWVFNAHFDHIGKTARLESSKLIIEKIKKLNSEELAVFLMGDLNLEPEAEGIQIILENLKDSKEIAELSFGPSGTFNGYDFSEPVKTRIDYIFTNDKIEIKKYAVLSDSKDLKYPSDHLPVMVIAKI